MTPRDHLLQRYFDGDLDEAERTAFERSLSASERARLTQMSALRAQLRRGSLSSVDAGPAELWPALQAEVGRVAGAQRWRRRSRRLGLVASGLAAAAALVFVLRPVPTPSDRCDVEQLEVGGAVATVLTLPDGDRGDTTVIWTEGD